MEVSNYGFAEAGEWTLKEGKSGVGFEIKKFENIRVIYAFIVDSETKYIGVCESSSTTLKDRLNRYKNLQGQGNNKRIVEEIKICLNSGKPVKIFALEPTPQLRYNGLTVDLVKGLENPLIQALNPQGNIQK